jgi:CRP/FNR family transcriptional regulator, cyclic AMP receptor protein
MLACERAPRCESLDGRAAAVSPEAASISIVDADPAMADLLDADERVRARRMARAVLRHLSTGAWDVTEAHQPDSHHRGFLIVDGLISREVEVMGRRCVELIGPGDVIRPWSWDEEGSHVRAEVGWVVLERTKLATLDHSLVVRMTPWPQLGLEIFNRGTRRAHALAVALAIAHHQRVDDRLLLTLWHLAERWGRVIPDGIAVPLPLSHQRLADLVGAHRPAVTSALGTLKQRGDIGRRGDRTWVVHGAPPAELAHHRLAATMT